MEHHHRNSEFSHDKWWIFPYFFVNVYQRVTPTHSGPPRPAGRWNGAEGASRCTDCPLGRASDVLGATVEAVCEAGKARFFRSI